MEIFNAEWFNKYEEESNFHSFKTIGRGFMVIFNIITNDNWYDIYIRGNESGNKIVTHVYLFLMIFIVNICLLGLALAIILDGFTIYMDKDYSSIEILENELLNDQ
jgi:hypothetical protein